MEPEHGWDELWAYEPTTDINASSLQLPRSFHGWVLTNRISTIIGKWDKEATKGWNPKRAIGGVHLRRPGYLDKVHQLEIQEHGNDLHKSPQRRSNRSEVDALGPN